MSVLPLPPEVDWPLRRKLDAISRYHIGGQWVRDEVGPIGTIRIGPQRMGPRLAPRVVMVTTPQGMRDVLARTDRATEKDGPFYQEFRRLGLSLVSARHDDWLPRRRTLQPVFTNAHMETYAWAMGTVVTETVKRWLYADVIDIQAEARHLTTEVFGRALFGTPLGHEADRVAADFDVISRYVVARAGRPLKSPSWLPTPQRSACRTSRSRLMDVASKAIAEAIRNPEHHAPLIRQMLEATDPETGNQFDQEDIIWELTTFLLAGHDTTSTALTYALWQLGREPKIQSAVADEAAALGLMTLTPADVQSLPTTIRVLHEALRMCPPGAANVRVSESEIEVDGYRVPGGWNLLANYYLLHRDPTAWENPEVFDPDRFLPERSAGRDRWQFLPFGAGQRKCIGSHFAMLEATIALATLVRDIEFTSLGPFDIQVGFTTHSAVPVNMRLRPRSARPNAAS